MKFDAACTSQLRIELNLMERDFSQIIIKVCSNLTHEFLQFFGMKNVNLISRYLKTLVYNFLKDFFNLLT